MTQLKKTSTTLAKDGNSTAMTEEVLDRLVLKMDSKGNLYPGELVLHRGDMDAAFIEGGDIIFRGLAYIEQQRKNTPGGIA